MHKQRPLIGTIITILVALFFLSVLKDILIKAAIEISSPSIIGANIEMGGFSLGLLNHRIHISNLRVYNPPGFPHQVFCVIPEVTVQVDIPELLQGKMHFPSVVFNMDKMILVKNKEGKLNVDSLKIVEEQQKANKGKPLKLPVFKIDTLNLNIGKVIVEDYTHAPPVLVEAYDVGVKNLQIHDINGLPKLVTIVLAETMKPTAIRSASLFAAEAVLGIGFLPAVAIGIAIAQDDEDTDMNHSASTVYRASLKLVHDLDGTVKQTDPHTGQISAKVYNCDITITVQDKGWGKSNIRIKARKYMLARLEIANGLLYQLTERLK